jgi:YgiT-type zinc finger domain-containing protein
LSDVTEKKPVCPDCQLGELRPGRVSYFAWADRRFVTVPDFPAWVCDVCGWREYDRAALSELQTLLNLNQTRQGQARRSLTAAEKDPRIRGTFLPRRRPGGG